MLIKFEQSAENDFEYFYKRDKQKIKRIIKLIEDIQKNPFEGIGKPEKLKHNLEGCLSRRIDKTNRLVYRIEGNSLIILSCRYHYDK